MERPERSAAAVPSRFRVPRTEGANLTTDAGSGLCGVAYSELVFFSGLEH